MPLILKQRATSARRVACTHCGMYTEAGRRAMSIFCPHCHTRVILETYNIRGYYGVIEFATCGDIVVERTGRVVAPVKVNKLTVKGSIHGPISARGKVTIHKTGSIKGDVKAPALSVAHGAMLEGFLQIGPQLDEES